MAVPSRRNSMKKTYIHPTNKRPSFLFFGGELGRGAELIIIKASDTIDKKFWVHS
jgi:hypothetical protein